MNHLSCMGPKPARPKLVQKAFSILAAVALVAGGLTAVAGATNVYANNGLTVDAVPNTGTLHVGDTLEVDFHDPTGTTDAIASTCLVNGVETASTFKNVSPGLYKVDYTVGANDQSRAAGQVPIDCTLAQKNTITVTAFDDNNTVAIDTSSSATSTGSGGTATSTSSTGGTSTTTSSGSTGSGSGAGSGTTGSGTTVSSSGSASENGGLTVSAVPSSGTLHVGDTLEVRFGDPSGTTDATASTCLVNGVQTVGTFANLSPGLYKVDYTVGANDQSRAAGQVPIDCTLAQKNTVHVVTFTDGNSVAIDTAATSTSGGSGTGTTTSSGGSGGTGTTTSSGGSTGGTSGSGSTNTSPLAISQVSVDPSTGTSTAGSILHVYFKEASGANDLTVQGMCQVNAVDVSHSFTNFGGGLYGVTYTVGQNDGERPAGNIPVSCLIGDSARGTVNAKGWTDGNTLAIDTNGDGAIDNGTNILGFSVTATPSSGTLHVGDTLHIAMQDPLPSSDVVIDPAKGCTVNGVNVAPSYQAHGNGLYTVDYTVGANDQSQAAGYLPIACNIMNSTGEVHLTYFTDGNKIAIDTNASSTGGSSTGSTSDNGGSSTTTSTSTGSISGDVNGGSSADAPLSVDSIEPVATTATAGGGFGHGWTWVFHLTVPNDETNLALKFGDWLHSNGTNAIAAAGNMRISSDQASSTDPISVTAADTYTAPLVLTGDLDPNKPGRQVDVKVEMQVPAGTLNGAYSTTYGVESTQ